jgi:hypothetical protein
MKYDSFWISSILIEFDKILHIFYYNNNSHSPPFSITIIVFVEKKRIEMKCDARNLNCMFFPYLGQLIFFLGEKLKKESEQFFFILAGGKERNANWAKKERNLSPFVTKKREKVVCIWYMNQILAKSKTSHERKIPALHKIFLQ